MRHLPLLLSWFLPAFIPLIWHGSDALLVSPHATAARFALVDDNGAVPIVSFAGDHEVVSIAVGDLASDIERVTGRRPLVHRDPDEMPVHAVIVGTLGRSPLIDRLVTSGKLDASALRGSWETFLIETMDAPLPGLERALVIAGSDRRGTVFGVYELSRAIGMSPWHWWADASRISTRSACAASTTRT